MAFDILTDIFFTLVCHDLDQDVPVPDFDGWHGWTVAAPSALELAAGELKFLELLGANVGA